METCEDVEVQLHASLTSVTPATLPQGNELLIPINEENFWAPGAVWTLWRRGKSLAPGENQTPRFLGRPARSPSPYWLSYTGSFTLLKCICLFAQFCFANIAEVICCAGCLMLATTCTTARLAPLGLSTEDKQQLTGNSNLIYSVCDAVQSGRYSSTTSSRSRSNKSSIQERNSKQTYSCLDHSSVLKIEAVRSSETSTRLHDVTYDDSTL